MSPKLQKVCNFYLSGMSMREAILKAGYSDGYASHSSSKFLHNRSVQQYIRERQKEEANAALADDIFLLSDLKRIIKDPNSDRIEKIEARKLLEKINARNNEIAAKIDEATRPPKDDIKSINISIIPAVKEGT